MGKPKIVLPEPTPDVAALKSKILEVSGKPRSLSS